ncbi:MAG: hypothetical protein L0154_12325, partial [Chloroflexi bacterium]|nr:hypothetical protein [Chloroflexota bacterium]
TGVPARFWQPFMEAGTPYPGRRTGSEFNPLAPPRAVGKAVASHDSPHAPLSRAPPHIIKPVTVYFLSAAVPVSEKEEPYERLSRPSPACEYHAGHE